MANKNTKKITQLDMDGEEIPENICIDGLFEGRNKNEHFLKDKDGNIRALKFPRIKKWCTGMGLQNEPFNCASCEEFDLWRFSVAKNKDAFKKSDEGKLKWSLMPFEQLEDVVRVLMAGAKKYGAENWRKCDDVNRYKDALMRHVVSYVKGEKNDLEDNLSHLAHAMCNCLFLMYFDKNEKKVEIKPYE